MSHATNRQSMENSLKFFAMAYQMLLSLDVDMQADAVRMIEIINGPNSSEEEKIMSMNTLEDMLYPPRDFRDVDAILKTIPPEHRAKWCSGGACACTGCANFCGVSYREWRRWAKENAFEVKDDIIQNIPQENWKPEGFVDIRIADIPDRSNTIAVMSAVRKATGMELKLTKQVVDDRTVIMQNVPRDKAEKIKASIEAAGAQVEYL